MEWTVKLKNRISTPQRRRNILDGSGIQKNYQSAYQRSEKKALDLLRQTKKNIHQQ
jgi:hypothetical protein